MTIEQAINKIDLGNCMLFTGAGFSKGAIGSNPTKELMSAWELAQQLYIECNGAKEEEGNLEDASNLYIETKGEFALIDFLKKNFTAYDITPAQEYIGSLQWKRIYTTNYDNVLDIAYSKNRKRLEKVYLSKNIHDYKNKSNMCIHLNGSIENLTPDTLMSEFKLTTISYLTEDFKSSEWVTLFMSDLQTSDAIFFIGYSMTFDLDIQRIVKDVATIEVMKNKCFFIVLPDEPKRNIRRIKKFGTPIPIGLDTFVELLKKRKPYDNSTSRVYHSFIKPTIEVSPSRISHDDIIQLFVKGDVHSGHLAASMFLPNKHLYSITRSHLKDIEQSIEKGTRNILIQSSLGNGKTTLLDELSIILTKKGYSIYTFKRYYDGWENEIESICTESCSKIVFVVDNYAQHRRLFEKLELFRTDQILIVAERTLTSDVAYEWLFKKFENFAVFDVDKLDADEIKSLVKIFDSYGLWGKKSALRWDLKEDYFRNDCHSSLRVILLNLLKSETIRKRFNQLIDTIKTKRSYYDALVLMLVSPLFEFNLDLDQLAFIFSKHQFYGPHFRNDSVIRELVNIDSGTITLRSSLLAESILVNIIDSDVIVDVLIKVFKSLDAYQTEENYCQILKCLLSHHKISRILNQKDSNNVDCVTRFFEEIRTTEFCKENEHYWLQYAIAKLFAHDYSSAYIFFNNAYAFAEKRQKRVGGTANYTYQIDNHFARYLLECEMEFGTKDTCMVQFRKAHELLINPANKIIVRFYTYKVARNYYRFYDRFFNDLKEDERREFVCACDEMARRAKWYIDSNDAGFSRKEDVRKTLNEMQMITDANKKYLK